MNLNYRICLFLSLVKFVGKWITYFNYLQCALNTMFEVFDVIHLHLKNSLTQAMLLYYSYQSWNVINEIQNWKRGFKVIVTKLLQMVFKPEFNQWECNFRFPVMPLIPRDCMKKVIYRKIPNISPPEYKHPLPRI